MKNIPFVIWMLGFPLVTSIVEYLSFLMGDIYSKGVELIFSIIIIIVWVSIGKLLYHKKDK